MPKPSKRKGTAKPSGLIFGPQNYLLLAGSVTLILAGFIAMHVDGQFLGFVSLTVAPIVILAGYALLIYAILRKPESGDEEPETVG